MSRIRSVHPGQWTDEDFVECSLAARLLVLGIRNEADDNGVFEWRATRLKMRLFPADTIDVAALLDEIEERGLVMRFSVDGRPYGAIRNFRVFQNPRSPKIEHPTTAEVETFVGDRTGEEAAPKRGPGRPRKQRDDETKPDEAKLIPQNAENNSLMERERREEKNSPSDSSIGEPTDARPPALALVPINPPPDDSEAAFAAYEALRREVVPNARSISLSIDRRRKLRARLTEIDGVAEWMQVLARIRGSPFLRGETSRNGFVAEIDWLLEPKNLRKVMEGNFDDNRTPTSGRAGTAAATIARAAIAAGLG